MASVALGILLFVALVWFASFKEIDLTKTNLSYAVACVFVYVFMLVLRALNFRLISSKSSEQSDIRDWCKLTSYHQLIFIAAPSGAGDLAFPSLAKKMVHTDMSNAVGTIFLSRIRDIFAIVGLGAVGLVGSNMHPPITGVIAVIAFASLIWTEHAIRSIINLLSIILPKGPTSQSRLMKLRKAVQVRSESKFLLNALTLSIWLCAGAGVWLGFSAAGYSLSIFECWIVVLFLNVAGALAVSFAGIGFAEVGAAGALMLFGETGSDAAAIAVVARPTMLVSLIIAALLLSLAQYFPRFARPPENS